MAKRPEKDEKREERIHYEIVVDAYNEDERAMGWYYYLEEQLHFPFLAKCRKERPISPLSKGDEVEVIGMAPEDECQHEMFVMVRWEKKEGLGVPLSQLKVIHGDKETEEAVDDWLYWIGQGYQF